MQERTGADREPVWLALSEFWLDTKLDKYDHKRIAEVLAESPYSMNELKDIERYEVAPVLWSNLIDVAGEWAGWDPDQLNQDCAEKMMLGRGRIRRIKTRLARCFVRYCTSDHWDAIEKLIPNLCDDAYH